MLSLVQIEAHLIKQGHADLLRTRSRVQFLSQNLRVHLVDLHRKKTVGSIVFVPVNPPFPNSTQDPNEKPLRWSLEVIYQGKVNPEMTLGMELKGLHAEDFSLVFKELGIVNDALQEFRTYLEANDAYQSKDHGK